MHRIINPVTRDAILRAPARAILALFLKITVVTLLASCAERGMMGYLETPAQAQNVETVWVATNRNRTTDGGFGKKRTQLVSYASYDLSIPDIHQPGNLEWPSGAVDVSTDFGVAARNEFASSTQFKAQINRALAAKGVRNSKGEREVQVFVHGFNTNFAESLYRMAQMKHDYEGKAPVILYSWPSAANPRLYIYDRDSVLSARDGLVEMLTVLANSQAEKITLTAHSLGTHLLMEAMRQIYLHGNAKIRAKIGAVILLSPDIDVDLFNSQVSHITPLPQPFLVFGSTQDRALRLMSWLSGEPKRVGNDLDPADIANKNITFFDVSNYTDGDKNNHFLLATSPTLLALIKRDFSRLEKVLPTFTNDAR